MAEKDKEIMDILNEMEIDILNEMEKVLDDESFRREDGGMTHEGVVVLHEWTIKLKKAREN